jgi:hypothetical protein
VFRRISFDQRSPPDFLNKPGVVARYLDLTPAAKGGFIELLQSNFL